MQLTEDYHEMVHLKEAQRILNINRNMMHDLIKSGSLPAQKVGKEWQILRKNLIIWLDQHQQGMDSGEHSPRVAVNSGIPAYYDDWT